MLDQASIFARIIKVDEPQRTVYGRAAQEVRDRSDEIFDYASSRPLFESWSAEVSADSAGKSLGNVRAMHGSVAAGKVTEISFDDIEKAIDVAAKIVDDAEWQKVLEGVYTGFSIGGRYVRKWTDTVDGTKVQRYTAAPTEISIVDRPCIPTAKFFNVQKADGSVLIVPFKATVDEIAVKASEFTKALVADLLAKDFVAPASATEGINAYRTGDPKSKRAKRTPKSGAPADDGDSMNADEPRDEAANRKATSGAELKKGMAGVVEFFALLRDLEVFAQGQQYEASAEGDVSPIPADLRARIADLAEVGIALVQEEAAELVAGTELVVPLAPMAMPEMAMADGAGKRQPTEESIMSDTTAVVEKTAPAADPAADVAKAFPPDDSKCSKCGQTLPETKKADTAADSNAALIAETVTAVIKALGLAPNSEVAPAAAAAPAPALLAVEKDGSVAKVSAADELMKSVEPIHTGAEVNKTASLIKAVHARGPDRLL